MAMDVSTQNEYSDQQLKYLSLKAEVDKEQHTLEDLIRQVKATEIELSAHVEDIEDVQNEEAAKRSVFEQKLSAVQETLSDVKLDHTEHVSDLNRLIAAESSLEEALKRELAILQGAESSAVNNPSEHSEELDHLANEHDLLEQNCKELASKMQEMHEKRLALVETLEQSKEQVLTLQQGLNGMRKDIAEKADKIEVLTEELFDVNLSLSTHQNKSLQENTESNSLYAEVDDKRVRLQNILDNMKSNHDPQQATHNQLAKIVSHLQKEQGSLQRLWLKDMEQIEEDNNSAARTFTNRKTLLKELIDILNSEVQEQLIERDQPSSETRWTSLINHKGSLIKELEGKLSNWDITEHFHAVGLAKVQKSIDSLRLKIEQLQRDYKEANKQLSHKDTDEDKCERPRPENPQLVGIIKKPDSSAKVVSFDNPKIVTDSADVTLQNKKSVKISADTYIPEQNVRRPLGRKVYVMKKK